MGLLISLNEKQYTRSIFVQVFYLTEITSSIQVIDYYRQSMYHVVFFLTIKDILKVRTKPNTT